MSKISLIDTKSLESLLKGLRFDEKERDILETNKNGNQMQQEDIANESSLCLTCKYTFLLRDDQVLHYKSDWHRYNTKLKLHDSEPVTEEDFEKIIDDISSISGSNSEEGDSEEEEARLIKAIDKIPQSFAESSESDTEEERQVKSRSSKLSFRNSDNKMITIYKCILPHCEEDAKLDINDIVNFLFTPTRCCIILLSAGHFAAAVFHGDEVKVHKTFHRYIVRAKQGTVQSANDRQTGNSAKSAGASLRRHNEAALIKEIQELLTSWKEEYLNSCTHIFLRASHYHKNVFFNGKSASLVRKDTRIHGIPFPTRRATFNEVKRVRQELFSVHICSDENPMRTGKKTCFPEKQVKKAITVTNARSQLTSSPDERQTKSPSNKRRKRKKAEESGRAGGIIMTDDTENLLTEKNPPEDAGFSVMDELYTVCKTGDLLGLEAIISSVHETPSETITQDTEAAGSRYSDKPLLVLLNQPVDDDQNTLLHVAARAGHRNIVDLLLRCGADPASRNKMSIVPYSVSSDKSMRNNFRKFMAEFPERYNYQGALVPGPLTEDMEKEQKRKQNEKKKAQRMQKKERLKEMAEEKQRKTEETNEKERFAALSDREKRAIAAERRLAQQISSCGLSPENVKRCWLCGESLLGKIPFEYLDFEFCTVSCLKKHKSLQKCNK